MLFSQYGRVTGLNFPIGKNIHSYIFVVFQDVAEAVRAKQALDNFFFISRPLKVDYSKSLTIEPRAPIKESDRTVQDSGTFCPR